MEVLLAQAADASTGSQVAETVLFWIFAVIALGAGIAVVTMRNIVHGALMLILNFSAVAGLFLTLESPFLSVVQILVYAGAIMVLFLFVIMLLGVDHDDLLATAPVANGLAVAGVALLAVTLLAGFVGPYTGEASVCGAETSSSSSSVACVGLAEASEEAGGTVALLGSELFTRYTFPFELSALLLTVATIGAVVLARRHDLPFVDEGGGSASDQAPPDPGQDSALADATDRGEG